jgi:hypothetical protein
MPARHFPKNPLARHPSATYQLPMLSDISIALVYVVLFFALGGIAFAYLLKGKN